MANADTPFGFRPVGDLQGRPYSGGVRKFFIPATDSTAVFIGTPVKLAGSADASGQAATVTAASSTNVVVGVVVGVEASTAGSTTYRAASTARYVYVQTDPDAIYEVQEVSGGTALTVTEVGLNANWTGSGGSTVTGLSSIELNNASEGTTATLDMQIIGLSPRADNALGEHAKWLVKLNNVQYVDGTTGV